MDDFLLGATVPGRLGRGCEKQPVIVAVERGDASRGPGRARVAVVPSCGSGAYSAFAEASIFPLAHVITDDWNGIRGGLAGWPGLDQRRFDASDDACRLPTAHHVISNFKAWVQGTFHGLSRVRLQGAATEFSWRYCHRSGGQAAALLADACRGHVPIPALLASFGPLDAPPDFKNRGPAGREHRRRVAEMVAEAIRALSEPGCPFVVGRM